MSKLSKSVESFEIGKTYKCIDVNMWIASDQQNKDASKFLDNNLEIHLDPYNYTRFEYDHGVHIEHKTGYSVFIEDKDKSFFTLVESPETSTHQHNTLDEQSINEAVKTLSQTAQELSVPITIDKNGNIVIYSDYHQEELTFDTAEKFMQYVECVKKMNKFGEQ